MYKLIALIIVAILSVVPNVVTAADGKGVEMGKIHIVNFARLLKEAAPLEQARKVLEQSVKKEKTRLTDLSKKLQSMKADLSKQSAVLSASAMEEKVASVRAFESEVELESQNFQDSMKSKNLRIAEQITKAAEEVAEKIASDSGAQVVFVREDRSVVYASSNLDITDKVLAELKNQNVKFDL